MELIAFPVNSSNSGIALATFGSSCGYYHTNGAPASSISFMKIINQVLMLYMMIVSICPPSIILSQLLSNRTIVLVVQAADNIICIF